MVWNNEESRLDSSGMHPLLLLSFVSQLHVLLAGPAHSRPGPDEDEPVRPKTFHIFDPDHPSTGEGSTVSPRRDHAVFVARSCPYHRIRWSIRRVHFTEFRLQGRSPC